MTKKTSPSPSVTTVSQSHFVRLLLVNERDLLRYVMVIVPNIDDARDVVQETAVRLWESIDQYDSNQPFIPWANRFALNCAREFLRRERRRKQLMANDVATLLEARRTELEPQLNRRREHLRDCLNRLSEDQKQLVRRYYFEGQPVPSIAEQLGRNADAIYKCLNRIRQILHECINRKLREEL